MTRLIKITVCDEQGILLDSAAIAVEDSETSLAIVTLDEHELEPSTSCCILQLGKVQTKKGKE